MDEKMHGSGNRDALYYDRLSLIRHQLEENGAACVRDIFNQSSLKLLEEAFQWSRDNASENAVVFPPTEHCPGYFYQDINNPDVANSVSPYVDIFQQTPLADFLSGIWQTEPIWFLYEQVLLKEALRKRV